MCFGVVTITVSNLRFFQRFGMLDFCHQLDGELFSSAQIQRVRKFGGGPAGGGPPEEVLSVLGGLVVSHINYVEDSKIQHTLEKWCSFSIEEVGAAVAEIEREDGGSGSSSSSPTHQQQASPLITSLRPCFKANSELNS